MIRVIDGGLFKQNKVEFDEMQQAGGIWLDIYESIMEADKIIRRLYPDMCIVQTKEDVEIFKRKCYDVVEKHEEECAKYLKEHGLDLYAEIKDEETWDKCRQTISDFTEIWDKEHPELMEYVYSDFVC